MECFSACFVISELLLAAMPTEIHVCMYVHCAKLCIQCKRAVRPAQNPTVIVPMHPACSKNASQHFSDPKLAQYLQSCAMHFEIFIHSHIHPCISHNIPHKNDLQNAAASHHPQLSPCQFVAQQPPCIPVKVSPLSVCTHAHARTHIHAWMASDLHKPVQNPFLCVQPVGTMHLCIFQTENWPNTCRDVPILAWVPFCMHIHAHLSHSIACMHDLAPAPRSGHPWMSMLHTCFQEPQMHPCEMQPKVCVHACAHMHSPIGQHVLAAACMNAWTCPHACHA